MTVTFALAWEGDRMPEDEKNDQKRSARGNETGQGPETRVQQKEVQRHIGVVREVISVLRDDDLANGTHPQPTDLAALVAETRDAGTDVDLVLRMCQSKGLKTRPTW